MPSVILLRPTFILNHISPYTGPGGGYTPDQMRTAYGINSISFSGGTVTGDGSGQTIAIVDAFNDPNIVGDLDTFDQGVYLSASDQSAGKTLFNRYGAASSFFSVFDQNGNLINPSTETTVPNAAPNPVQGSWATEESLDVEWAHSIAPGAKIDLIEATSNLTSDLFTGVVTAGGLSGVSAVSMSFGGGEATGESSFDSDFVHKGVTFLASTGDSGAPGGYPAYSPNVVAVGGTTLNLNPDNTYKSETGWSGSGGGVSSFESEPSYQNAVQNTGKRTIPDVAFDADPNTGAAVYDSWDFPSGPWIGVGGTSLSCPCWAGLIAITNQGRLLGGGQLLNTSGATQVNSFLYGLSHSDFHDNLGVYNGSSTTGLTNPAVYDENTGLGSPVANVLVPDLASQGVASKLTISPSTLPVATAKDSYGPITFSATGGSGSYTFALASGSKLPAGLTLKNGVLSGTPTTAGKYTFTITATDTNQPSLTGSQMYTLTVNKAITITPATLPVATVNDKFSKQLVATGGSGTGYSFALASGSNLPAGLTLSSTGLLSGTPTASGKFTFTVVVTDSNGATGTKTYTLTIDPAITISPSSLPPAKVGQHYSQQFTASGGSGTGYVFKATGLPAWLKLSTTGILSGTPPSGSPASITFTVIVTDSKKGTVSQQYTLTINP